MMTSVVVLGVMGCTNSESIELQGKLTMRGSAPHTMLTLYDDKSGKLFQVQNGEKYHLDRHQNQTIKVRAKLIKGEIGPGFPAIIEVIEVK